MKTSNSGRLSLSTRKRMYYSKLGSLSSIMVRQFLSV